MGWSGKFCMGDTPDQRRSGSLPQITFVAGANDAKATPTAAALIVTQLVERLGLGPLLHDLGMGKDSGVEVEHVILVFLLMASYGATSLNNLVERLRKDTSLAAIVGGVEDITNRVAGVLQPAP